MSAGITEFERETSDYEKSTKMLKELITYWDDLSIVKTRPLIQFLPLPPIAEQKRIAAKLQELMQEVDRARTACEQQHEAINALPQAILRRAFKGEL